MMNHRSHWNAFCGLLAGSLALGAGCDLRGEQIDAAELELGTATVSVPGTANLYQNTLYPTVGADPAVPVPDACIAPGGQIDITATGCAVDRHSDCTGPDGDGSLFRGLPVYSLIGQWSTSPTSLDSATAVASSFFVGSANTLTAPAGGGPYYLFLGDNDGIFSDNSGAYQVDATWYDTTAPDLVVSEPQYLAFPRSWALEEFTLADCASVIDNGCDAGLDIDAVGEIVAISVDEPPLTANHDCDLEPELCIDIEIVDNSTFRIRNTRDSYGDGRVYTIDFTVADSAGNVTEVASCQFGVRLWGTQVPVAGPAAYTVTP